MRNWPQKPAGLNKFFLWGSGFSFFVII